MKKNTEIEFYTAEIEKYKAAAEELEKKLNLPKETLDEIAARALRSVLEKVDFFHIKE